MPLPSLVAKANGRPEPFDGDRISRALFAATELLGRPDPFLARELTDGVLHFLAAEQTADPIPIGDVVDATLKIVRELGHPALARAFQESRVRSREPAVGDRESGLLTPDLQAAERDGLLQFFDADARSLAGIVLPPGERAWMDGIATARDRAGQFVAIDGPEFLLSTPSAAAEWAREWSRAVQATGLVAVVNLNAAEPPGWAAVEGGPLFGPPQPDDADRRREVAAAIAQELLEIPHASIRVDWHLGAEDFRPANRNRLIGLVKYVADDASIAFVTDRPRRPLSLAGGLDRDHPAVLAAVGVGLPRLLEIIGADRLPLPDGLFAKIGSLARLALSAGHAHRAVLRRYGSGGSAGFLLDRARLLVVPIGLGEIVQSVATLPHAAGRLALARDILLGLNSALLRDASRVPSVIGTPPPLSIRINALDDIAVTPEQQLRAAAAMHTAIGSGTAVISIPAVPPRQPSGIAELLSFAWQQPGLDRFYFCPRKPVQRPTPRL